MRRITIKDIAREAGVSPQTVSRAINNKGEIRPQTRERILRIAERLGYRPNSVARSLATQRTQNVGLVVPDVSNPFFAEVARGIADTAHQANYNVFLCNTDENVERERSAVHSLEAQRVDGIILCSSRLSEGELIKLADRYGPLVLVNRQIDHPRTGCVLVDDAQGTEDAVRYLLELGHHSIGLLAGPEVSHSGRERKRGYLEAMRAHRLTPRAAWQMHCPPQASGGQAAAGRLLRRAPELTSLLAYNDLVAVGALRACAELGLDVPGDLAIVGCDDIPLAALVSPALTTIHIPKYDLGQQAMGLLLSMMRDEDVPPGPIVLLPQLVIRDSATEPTGGPQPLAKRSLP
ncbi:MAG: LacI family DNA-binding transcriptional regulator [Anaerolineae bacterium]|nr:LacI family DNA-binding transcriptional regulator [Anaerolineae bacterium]